MMSVYSKSYTSEEVHSTLPSDIGLRKTLLDEVLGLLSFKIIAIQVRNIIPVRERKRADLVSCACSGPPTKKGRYRPIFVAVALGLGIRPLNRASQLSKYSLQPHILSHFVPSTRL
jgi:hypothetical protein